MAILPNFPHRWPLMAATGHHAPTSGWWRPDHDLQAARYISQGEVMPSLKGSRAVWVLFGAPVPSIPCGQHV